MTDEQPQPQSQGPQQILQMLQQKIGNVELTTHALIRVLDNEDIIDEEQIHDEAEEIVKEMQEQMPDVDLKQEEIQTKGDDEEQED